MGETLTKRTALASGALLGAKLFVKLIDFTLILILARILVPEDFALVALATVFIQFTEAVLELPVTHAVIRAPVLNDKILDTAFTISLLRATILMAIAISLAPAASVFFDEPRLAPLMVLTGLAPAFRGMVNPKLVLYGRRLNYFPEAAIEVAAKVVTAIIVIPFATNTSSYWSLALMAVLAPVLMFVGSYVFAPYRPRLTLQEWSTFSNMISWTTVYQVFSGAAWQFDMAILGRTQSQNIIGRFSVAQSIAHAPLQSIVTPILKPFTAAYSMLNQRRELQDGYSQGLSALFTLVAPIFTLIILCSDLIISILFDDSWQGADLFLSVISVSALISLTTAPLVILALSVNKAKYNAAQSMVSFVSKAILMGAGLYAFGINGFLLGQICSAGISALVGFFIAKRLTELTVYRQAKVLFRPFAALAFTAVLGTFIRLVIPEIWNPIATLLVTCLSGTISYVVALSTLWYLTGKPDGIEQKLLELANALFHDVFLARGNTKT